MTLAPGAAAPTRGATPVPLVVRDRERASIDQRLLAIEAPVSIEVNGLAYAVMMATPIDLEDFAWGFAIAEGMAPPAGILDVNVAEAELGWVVRITIDQALMGPMHERIRRRVSDGGCGLCGVENLEQAMRLPPMAVDARPPRPAAVFHALEGLRQRQALNQATGAVHGAALCDLDGAILEVREDVGRHNAFDKLVGSLARRGASPADGFALLTSRCSYELVDKALMAGFGTLVTVSAATSLAADRAKARGLTLVALARMDSWLVINDPHRAFD